MKNINSLSATEVNYEVEKILIGKRSNYKFEELLSRAKKLAEIPARKSMSNTKNQKKKYTY